MNRETQEDQKAYGKAVANLLLNFKSDLRGWYILNRRYDPYPAVVPFLAYGVIAKVIPMSLARFTLEQHVKQLQARDKHGQLKKEGQDNPAQNQRGWSSLTPEEQKQMWQPVKLPSSWDILGEL